MLVRDVMTRDPITVRRDTPVTLALAMLSEHHITAMPVVTSAGRLCGMVAEIDLMRDRIPRDQRAHALPLDPEFIQPPEHVEEVMTPVSVAITDEADVAEAVDIMIERSLRSLPVLDGERLIGVVSRSDVARALARDDDQ